MGKHVQFIRYSTAESLLYTGLQGEITVDLTNNSIRVHDGSKAGGFETARADLANIPTATSTNAGKMSAAQALQLSQAASAVGAETIEGPLTIVDGASTGLVNYGSALNYIKGGVGTYGIDMYSSGYASVIGKAAANLQDNLLIYPSVEFINDLERCSLLQISTGTFAYYTAHLNPGGSPVLQLVLMMDEYGFQYLGNAVWHAGNDGVASGLDADLLDGNQGAAYSLKSENLSGLASYPTARTNLGVAIGTDVQAYNAGLTSIAGLAVTDGNIIVGNGTTWVTESGATARASLGLTIGTDVQAYDANIRLSDYKIKTTNTSKSTDTTLADDPHLAGWNLEANANYAFRFLLYMNANATGDLKFAFQSSASISGFYKFHAVSNNAVSEVDSALISVTEVVAGSSLYAVAIEISGTLLVGGSSTTVDFQWAQNSSVVNFTTLTASSYGVFTKISA